MINSVISWDPQKTCCNYQSSEEVLVQESSHKCPRARFTNTDKTWPVENQTSSPNLNSPRTHTFSFLLPLSLSSFPAAFAKVDELATVNGIILNISHAAAPRLVKENHRVMALLCTFIQYLSAGNSNAVYKHKLIKPHNALPGRSYRPPLQTPMQRLGPLCSPHAANPWWSQEMKARAGSPAFLTLSMHNLAGSSQQSFFSQFKGTGGGQLQSGGSSLIPSCFGIFPPLLSSQSSARGGIKNDDPSAERSFLCMHLGGGKSTVQWVEGWTAPVKTKVPRLPWVPPLHTKPTRMGGEASPPSPDPRGPARATGLLPVHQEPEEMLLPRAGNGAAEQILPAPPLNYLMSYRSR